MSGAGASRPATVLVGRDDEVAHLGAAVEAARAGRPTVALVVGEAGIGKSTLVAAVVGQGRGGGDAHDGVGLLVIHASGDEAESELDYGILDQLARGFPVDSETRARAQNALSSRPGAEPHRVGAAMLRLLDATPFDGPLVVVVDDAQWADLASLEALAFVARRLQADAVLLCLVSRPEGLDRLPPALTELTDDRGVRIELGPLGTEAVAEMARRSLGRPLPPAAAERLRAHTAGIPLHARALLEELSYDAIARRDVLPAPRSYAALVLSRLAASSPRAQAMMGALAVLGAPAPVTDVAAVAAVDAPTEAVGELIDELVERKLVEVVAAPTGRVLAFPHGLVHASVSADLSPSRRAALHARAAAVTSGDEALRHRLAAAHGPEPELVAAAREAASRHIAAGARATAARILLDAAPLAATAAERQHLVAVAASHLVVTGQLFGPLAAGIDELPDCAHRSYVLGHQALARGSPAEAGRLLARAWGQIAAEPEAAELAGSVTDMLAILALHERRNDDAVAWGRRGLAAESDSTMSATLICRGLALAGGFEAAEQEMTALLGDGGRTGARGAQGAVALDARLGRGIVRVWSNDLDGAERDLAEAADLLGQWGTFLTEVNVRTYRAELALRTGRWAEALDLAETTASLLDDSGALWLVPLPHGVAAFVLAAQGRTEPARDHAEAAARGADASTLMPARMSAAHAWLRVASAGGDHAGVVAVGDRMAAEGWDVVPEGVHRWRATYVESLVAVGRVGDAGTVATALAVAAASTPRDLAVATEAARAQGLVAAGRGDRDGADAAFDAGLVLDDGRRLPFERALLELAAGTHRRRSGRRRRAAADLLRHALDRFDALGAAPWYERAARELERCGLQPRKRSDAYDRALTAQERLVAHLVAGGHTNREVADELLISIKTVEHHLGRVYAKLGLRSRTELAARLGPAAPG